MWSETSPRALPGGLEGCLDLPLPGAVTADEIVQLRGWVLGRVREVSVRWPGAPTRRLPLTRADDGAVWKFDHVLPIESSRPGEIEIEVWAQLTNGKRVQIFTRKVQHPGTPILRPGLATFLRSAAAKGYQALRDGRLQLSPRQWTRDLQHHYRQISARGKPSAPPAARADADAAKRAVTESSLAVLRAFLASGTRLAWPELASPAVSVVLVLLNRAELTLRCLRALHETTAVPLEIILIDNGSTDATGELLARLDGVTTVRHTKNRGFVDGVNEGAGLARGRHLLFLNNDAELLPGSLEAATAALDGDPTIGAVGGKLILHHGALQEAGSIIWSDGSCVGYGRGDAPDAPAYAFEREVDFCSGALLATPRELFQRVGGFDAAYRPAYYEEVDYCVRLWKLGQRVVYRPDVAALHFEFASSSSPAEAMRMQRERRQLFVARAGTWLAGQWPSTGTSPFLARSRRPPGLRILFLDDRVPRVTFGSGCPRALEMVRVLSEAGHQVTLYPTTHPEDEWSSVYRSVPRRVEVMIGCGVAGLAQFLAERAGCFDRIIVSRPHNMQILRARLKDEERRRVQIVYDAEAIFALREARARRVAGARLSQAEIDRAVGEELAIAQSADVVLSASQEEQLQFAKTGARKVLTLGHGLQTQPTLTAFESRNGLLFIGAFHAEGTPNTDSILWFAREVLPRIRRTNADVWLTIAGAAPPRSVLDLSEGVEVLGQVEDLRPLYEGARIFIAPTRFAAGLPFKVHHAAAHGVPIVCTSLLADQLGWRAGEEVLVADDPGEFAEACVRLYQDRGLWHGLRERALLRVERDCSPQRFAAILEQAVGAPGK